MNERVRTNKELAVNTVRALGGMAVIDLGISYIQENATLGADILGASGIALGAITALKGTDRLLHRLLMTNKAQEILNKPAR